MRHPLPPFRASATPRPVKTELRNRLLLGPLLAAVVVGAILTDLFRQSHLGILAIALVACSLGCREYARLARALAPGARLAPVLAISLLLVLEGFLHGRGDELGLGWHAWALDQPVAVALIGLGLVWTVLAQMGRHGFNGFFATVGATTLGILYLGVPFNLLLRLACLDTPTAYYGDTPWAGQAVAERGSELLVVFIAAVKMGDISAFAGGMLFGRHKLCPGISPGKTWEGFACSFAGSIGGTCLFAWLLAQLTGHGPFAAPWQAVVWGLVLGPLGALGDLAESCMKRAAAVKDSGRIMPGFGGILDLLDAVLLAAPVGYLLALVI